MPINFSKHNTFRESLDLFNQVDPHLRALAKLEYQHSSNWWQEIDFEQAGIYILTGGRQVGKSTSCKLLILHCLKKKLYKPEQILYLPCDEIFDAKELSQTLRTFLDEVGDQRFLLIIDEVTYVKHWERVIKSLADEGQFSLGTCILTGSDTLILKEAAMSFPGRRGQADIIDFHLYPLTFAEYAKLRSGKNAISNENLGNYFDEYLQCGGYLRAINDLATTGKVTQSTYLTYEQWIRGDFLRQGKNENTLLAILCSLLKVGVSPTSYSSLTQKTGIISKDTCIDYIQILERMDVLFELQAYDQNTKRGFPRKDRKFHFVDPFIHRTLYEWVKREGLLSDMTFESILVEACAASHCHRLGKTYYFKGQGEIDIIWLNQGKCLPIEVKWSNQIRPNDLKMLKQWKNSIILGKSDRSGTIDDIQVIPVYRFLCE